MSANLQLILLIHMEVGPVHILPSGLEEVVKRYVGLSLYSVK